MCVCIRIFSNKLDLNQETSFYYIIYFMVILLYFNIFSAISYYEINIIQHSGLGCIMGTISSLVRSLIRTLWPAKSYRKMIWAWLQTLLLNSFAVKYCIGQGILKGEILLYRWPPVWLVWISLFCKWKQKLSVVI